MKVVAISGSLRQGSFNTAALRAAQELAPEGMEIAIAPIGEFPLYDEDVKQRGFPAPVAALRAAIAASDGLLLATPEYNYSVSGVLKNAIDWCSRPPDQPFDGKPIAIMGASVGVIGTARAQYHLRQMFVFLNGNIVNRPEVMIGQAASRFDEAGRLTDEATRGHVAKLLEALAAKIRARGARG